MCRPCGVGPPGPVSMLVMTWLRAAGCTASAAPCSLQPAARRLAGMPGRRPRVAAVGAALGWVAGSPLRARIEKGVCEQPGQRAPRLLERVDCWRGLRAARPPGRRRVRRGRAAGAPASARDPRAAPGGGRRAGAAGRLGAAVLACTARQPACRARGARRPGARSRRGRGMSGCPAVRGMMRRRARHVGGSSSMKGGCRRLRVWGSAVSMDGNRTSNTAPHWSADLQLAQAAGGCAAGG